MPSLAHASPTAFPAPLQYETADQALSRIGTASTSHLDQSTSVGQCRRSSQNSTVAYAFLTRATLPLWSVWEQYLRGCDGRAVVLFHAQDLTIHDYLRNVSAPFNGFVLPANQTVLGNPRFSFDMVAMMLRLYQAASTAVAPNGCAPRWVHLASERDLPVRQCPTIHALLSATPGVSWMNYRRHRLFDRDGQSDTTHHFKRSQWSTLWLPHAAAVATSEASLRAFWTPRIGRHGVHAPVSESNETGNWSMPGALDEVVISFAFHRRNFPVYDKGLTFICWGCDSEAQKVDGHKHGSGSPDAVLSSAAAIRLCHNALDQGYCFIRKVGDGSPESSAQVSKAIAGPECLNLPSRTT